MRKKRTIIGVLILCLSIGFASIATNLIINNTTSIGKNINDFDVYFSGALLDGVDKSNELINKSNKKEIYFTSNNLKATNDESILEYEITNNSSNYDAEVSIKCEYTNTDTSINNRITITVNPTNLTIEAKSIGNGSITAKLNEMATEEVDVPIVCTLTANAIERTSKNTTEMKEEPYSISGYLVNKDESPVANAYLSIYSNIKHIVKTDIYGYFYVENLERGMHEIYYLNDLNPTEMSKEEIESQASAKVNISTNQQGKIILDNGYKITNIKVGNKEETHNKYIITLDKDNGENNEELEVTQNNLYGTLPTPSKTGYNFLGWYLSDKIIDENVIVKEGASHTLTAHWDPKKYTVTFNANGGSLSSEDDITKSVTYKKSYGALPETTRYGYTCVGWYTSEEIQDETTKVTKDDIYNIADNQTLYAKWEANTYTVKFDANGGSVSTKTKEVVFNEFYEELPEATKDGYRFDGWFTSSSGGKKIESTDILTSEGIILYASWTKLALLTVTADHRVNSSVCVVYNPDGKRTKTDTYDLDGKLSNDGEYIRTAPLTPVGATSTRTALIPVGYIVACATIPYTDNHYYHDFYLSPGYLPYDINTVPADVNPNEIFIGKMTESGLTYISNPYFTAYMLYCIARDYRNSGIDQVDMYRQVTSFSTSIPFAEYIGSNPDNYVVFNCDNYEKRENCELWRIIGSSNKDYLTTGQNLPEMYRMKIVRDTVDGTCPFYKSDTCNGDDNTSGCTDNYLNSNVKSFVENQVKEDALKYIDEVGWPVGRSINSLPLGSLGQELKSETNPTKIGLISTSEYLLSYSTKNGTTVGVDTSPRINNPSWLFKGPEWTMTPMGRETDEGMIRSIEEDGRISDPYKKHTFLSLYARPAAYLLPETRLCGWGTKEQPYYIC